MDRFRLTPRARRSIREIGSIVLGVLIALGIGEVADSLRWRARAADSNRAMDVELARAAGVVDERVMVQPCLTRRLAALSAIVRQARRTGTLPDIGPVGAPPLRPLQTSAWDDVLASGTLLHLEAARRSMLSLNYPILKTLSSNTAQERAMWSNLKILEGVPGPASDTLLVEAAGIVARLQFTNDIMGLTAEQNRDDLIAHGIRPSYFLVLDREGTRAEVVAAHRARRSCRPLQVSPAGSG